MQHICIMTDNLIYDNSDLHEIQIDFVQIDELFCAILKTNSNFLC